jgi:hypothetical protein
VLQDLRHDVGSIICSNAHARERERTGQSFTQHTSRNRAYLEELDIAESIILKWILKT